MAILAEACTNWVDISGARDLIRVSHDCGAALTKFQLFSAESDRGTPHYAWVKAHELTFEQAKELFAYGDSIGQEVFFSVFGAPFVPWCEAIGVRRYKIACEFRDRATLEAIWLTRKPILLSVAGLPKGWERTCDCLYCVPAYPANRNDLQLREITFGSEIVGFSDHTLSLTAAKFAIARGAKIIERHFTLDRSADGPDQAWSMTPSELEELCEFDRETQEIQ